jgi:hypothetical protein
VKTGWEVKRASVSSFNGGLLVEGINHDASDPLFHQFSWHIREYSVTDKRYDFAGCEFVGSARDVYTRLLALAEKRGES